MLDEHSIEQMIGQKVEKKSGKPFKSTLKVNTVKSVISHPILQGEEAYTFEEDDSYVSVCQMLDRVCQNHNVFYHHHHDEFETPRKGYPEDLKNAIIVIYSSQFGHWSLAINEDGSVVKPGHVEIAKLQKLQEEIQEKLNNDHS